MNKLPRILFIILILELLCGVSCIFKGKLTDKERNLLKDVEKFNRDYGSKGVTIKNRKIKWEDQFVCNGLILKNSIIKNVELVNVDLENTYIEDSIIENVSISEDSDLSNSTFKNVKFKNFKSINKNKRSYFRDSIFIDCEFINCEYSDVSLGKEYRNCKFNKVKEIEDVYYYDTVATDCTFTNCKLEDSSYSDGRFENVIFKDSVVRSGFDLKYGKNIQFINCIADFGMTATDNGKIEDVLVQNAKLDEEANVRFFGNMCNIEIRDCPKMIRLWFMKGSFNNISIINCKYPVTVFDKIKLSNLLIRNSIVQHLRFDEADVSGDNRIENSEICGNVYSISNIRNLTITDCKFKDYIDIVFSELIRLRLINNVYEINDGKYGIKELKYTDSDKFPLNSIPFPDDDPYVKKYYRLKKTNK